MSTVKSLILRLAQRIDPYTKAMVELNSTTVGTTDGDKFTIQRRVDIWNEARFALGNAIDKKYPNDKKQRQSAGEIYKDAAFVFASGVAAKPSDMIDPILLTNASGTVITILPPAMIIQARDLISATNLMVFDYTTSFTALDGDTYVVDGSDYVLYYYRIPTYAISDVAGSTVESFEDRWVPTLLQLAEAIANEMGQQAVNQVAENLLGEL
jgi:hypothetical protein